MVWTKEEEELIAILDSFINNYITSKEIQNINYHLLLQQVLLSTEGEVAATRKYCQTILETKKIKQKEQDYFLAVKNKSAVEKPIKLTKKDDDNFQRIRKKSLNKVKSFWATLFVISSLFVIFFSAKRSPNLSSNETFSNVATFCPSDLIEKAETGIINQDKLILEQAIASFQELKQPIANQLGVECEQIFWESQYVYAINFLASEGNRKTAVETLCSIPAQYYQNKNIIPWFTRWSNTNSEFERWLQQYQLNNECAAAAYLK